MPSRVFVVEYPRNNSIDLSTAKGFGELTELFSMNRRRSSIWSAEFRNVDLPATLEDVQFDVENDFIAFAGNTAMTMMVVAKVLKLYGKANVLLFNSYTRTYVSVILE